MIINYEGVVFVKTLLMLFLIATFTWLVGPTSVVADKLFYGPYVNIDDLDDHVWGSWCSWSKWQTSGHDGTQSMRGWGTFSDGKCSGITKRRRAQTKTTGFYVLVADAKDAQAYYMDIASNRFKTADDLSQSALDEAHGNNTLYDPAEALADQVEETVDDSHTDSEEEIEEVLDEELSDSSSELYEDEEGVEDVELSDSSSEVYEEDAEVEDEQEELVEPDWSVTTITLEVPRDGWADIYQWNNNGAHGTLRSVKYTDDEIESINHMIAIEMFPWPHARGLTESFNLGVTIGQCEGEWSYHHSSGIEPWGSIPGNEIREYCSEKATGIDVSKLYP